MKELDCIPGRRVGPSSNPQGSPRIKIASPPQIYHLSNQDYQLHLLDKTLWEQSATRSARKVQPESFRRKSPDQQSLLSLHFWPLSSVLCIVKPEWSFQRVTWTVSPSSTSHLFKLLQHFPRVHTDKAPLWLTRPWVVCSLLISTVSFHTLQFLL